jgi:hypothetical protein
MTPIARAPSLRHDLAVRLHTLHAVNVGWEELFEGGSDAWETLFAAIPDGWAVQKPVRDPDTGRWLMYAFAQRKGDYSAEAWTAEAPGEDLVVYEMARCLREISEGRTP